MISPTVIGVARSPCQEIDRFHHHDSEARDPGT